MDARPVKQWIEIFGKLPSPTSETAERTIANRVIGDLVGYSHRSKHRDRDAQEIANAMIAYATLMQQAGVKL